LYELYQILILIDFDLQVSWFFRFN